MEFIKFPVTYTKTVKPNSPNEAAYNSVLEELNITYDEDTEVIEVHDYIYVQREALQNVTISPYIKNNKIIPGNSILEYGETANEIRVFMMVRMPVEELVNTLKYV